MPSTNGVAISPFCRPGQVGLREDVKLPLGHTGLGQGLLASASTSTPFPLPAAFLPRLSTLEKAGERSGASGGSSGSGSSPVGESFISF